MRRTSFAIPLMAFVAVQAILAIMVGFNVVYAIEFFFSVGILVFHLLCALTIDSNTRLLEMPAVIVTVSVLVAQLVIEIVVVTIGFSNVRALMALGVALVAIEVMLFLASKSASGHAREFEKSVRSSTAFIDTARRNVRALAPMVPDDARTDYDALVDVLRYANPVSGEYSSDIEQSINQTLARLGKAASAGNVEAISRGCVEATRLLRSREAQCEK